MKASVNTLESLADIDQVREAGQIRRIGGQMLLAMARKEISATDLMAASKMIEAQANHMKSEVNMQRAIIEMRKHGADLGKTVHLGKTIIGTPDDEREPT